MLDQPSRHYHLSFLLSALLSAASVVAQTGSPPGEERATPSPWVKIAEVSRTALVLIETEKGQGSGFLVRPNGTIVTNHHVIADAKEIRVTLDSGEIYRKAHILASDEAVDLAILRIEAADLPTLALGNSNDSKVGESVLLLGAPKGLAETVSSGVISGIRLVDGTRFIQTDAAASPGSSGGPLLNTAGQVVGILKGKWALGGESLNFSIAVNYARGMLDALDLSPAPKIAATLEANSLGHVPTSEITGEWKSMASGSIKVLREDGDYIYGESFTSDHATSVGVFQLKKQPDGTFSGTGRSMWRCSTLGAWGQQIDNSCSSEYRLVIAKVEGKRIEGRAEDRKAPPVNNWGSAWPKYCKTCGESVPATWVEFVWVKTD